MNEIKNEVCDEVSVIATIETEIGTFEYLSNGTLLNNESIIIEGVPSLDCINDVIDMCFAVYNEYGCICATYDSLIDFVKSLYE